MPHLTAFLLRLIAQGIRQHQRRWPGGRWTQHDSMVVQLWTEADRVDVPD